MRRALKTLGLLAGLAAGAFVLSWLLVDPHLERAEAYPGGTVLRDAAGRVLRVSLGPGDVDCRPYYAARPHDWIVQALVASEDRRFFSHRGVDLPSVARALFQNLAHLRRVSGASTITMQASRLFAPHPHTLAWKYVEAFRALQVERARDKLWILSQYLNRAPFGSNLVGVEAAAHGWFGKSARDLSLGEAALLAGMVQSPSRFRPDRHLDRALARRAYVLGRMRALGMITAEQHAAAAAVVPAIRRAPRPFAEPFFCDWALRHVARRGARGGDFATTLDANVQRVAQRVAQRASEGGARSAAAVVMRVDTGAVVALACSDDYFSRRAGQVNTALAPRPAGSTLKPFLMAYGFDHGQVSPDERLADVPRAYPGYNPQNFDASFRGAVSAADALVLSLNLPFVELLQRVGVTRFGTLLRSLGLANMKRADDTFGLGMAIGNVHVSLLELCAAYATLAHGGALVEPRALQAEEAAARAERLRVFSPGAAYLVSDILGGEARSADALGHVADVRVARFAWKTGTSAAFRDAWTLAWNPAYVVGVWCGHKEGHFGDTAIVGAQAAAPYCWELARALYPAQDGPWFRRPPEVVPCTVCAASGRPAAPECPATRPGRMLRGGSSPALCTLHRRGTDGAVVTCPDAYLAAFSGATNTVKLAIAKPDDHSEFRLVPNLPNQRIVCQTVGNAARERLWWFVDGRNAGETVGSAPFVWTPALGDHVLTCATSAGVSASVHVTVKRDDDP